MPSGRFNPLAWLFARVHPILPTDWTGHAGKQFRNTMQSISEYAEESGVREGMEEGLLLAGNKLEGLANKEYAASLKDFAEAEEKNIQAELQRRSFDFDLRRKEAETRKAEIQAKRAEVDLLSAEHELYLKLKVAGVIITKDEVGNMTVLPVPNGCDLTLAREILHVGDQ